MATVSLVILLQNFKEQKRERPGDRNKGKEREFFINPLCPRDCD